MSEKDSSCGGIALFRHFYLFNRFFPTSYHILTPWQVSVSLMESGNPFESHDQLIELVSSSETGFINLFSQQQLQVSGYLFISQVVKEAHIVHSLYPMLLGLGLSASIVYEHVI